MHLHLSRFGSTLVTSTFLLCIKIVNMDAACLWREKSTQETQRTLSLSRVSYQQFFQLYNWSALMLVTVADILLAACLTISSTTSCVRYCSQVMEYCSCIGEACDGNKIFLKYCYCIWHYCPRKVGSFNNLYPIMLHHQYPECSKCWLCLFQPATMIWTYVR